MFSRSSVAQSACCLLKALKAKLLIVTTLDTALGLPRFAVLCSVPFFFFFSSHPESLLPRETRGVTVSHSPGYEVPCLCTCVRAVHGGRCDSVVWAVKPEEWAEKERSGSSTMQTVQGSDLLPCPLSSPLSLGENTTAAADTTERHPSTAASFPRLRLVMPYKKAKGPRRLSALKRS